MPRREIHALYQVIKVSDQFVWIVDQDAGKSITNDADYVVRELLPKFSPRRIIYRDTMGAWDELVHNGERFVTFAPARNLGPDHG